MKSILLAGAALLSIASAASAANVITFSQTSGVNTVFATVNAADTQTTITATNAAISIGQILGGGPAPASLFSLTATSFDAATTLGSAVIQHYNGSFCITTAAGCGGTNVLSGVFTDAAFGALSGPGLAVNVNSPPDTLTLTSSLFTPAQLGAPSAFTLGLTNLLPSLSILGTTIAPFNASFAGTVSATQPTAASEPTGLALVGIGLLGLGVVKARAKRARSATPNPTNELSLA